MKCHTNVNSTPFTQLPHKFSYIVAILGHNHFESPNISNYRTPASAKIVAPVLRKQWPVNNSGLGNFKYCAIIFGCSPILLIPVKIIVLRVLQGDNLVV
jgi:hypothetical protein